MVIAVDLTSLSYHITGIERFALCITQNLINNDQKNSYILIFKDNIFEDFTNSIDGNHVKSVVLNGKNKYIFNIFQLPYFIGKIRADKYLFLAFASPILFKKSGIITTIHDMGAWDCPQALTFKQRIYCKMHGKLSANNAETILTVSNFSKERISKLLHLNSSKVKVIYSAVSEKLISYCGDNFEEIQKKYDLPDKYIMTLSTLEPRKNMELLLKAFTKVQDKVDYDLVLVGRKGWKMDEVLERYNLKERIHMTGFVEDEHVSVIYKKALCFVFPTLYEGFGLPPVEALSMGTPVISSDAASMPEVLRNQAVYFKSNNQQELEKLLLNLEDNVNDMPRELDDFQKDNYRFDVSAKKILDLIGE